MAVMDTISAVFETLKANMAIQILLSFAIILILATKLRSHAVPDIKVEPPTGEQETAKNSPLPTFSSLATIRHIAFLVQLQRKKKPATARDQCHVMTRQRSSTLAPCQQWTNGMWKLGLQQHRRLLKSALVPCWQSLDHNASFCFKRIGDWHMMLPPLESHDFRPTCNFVNSGPWLRKSRLGWVAKGGCRDGDYNWCS